MDSNMVTVDPLSLTYMKIIRFFLTTIGAWPSESNSGWSYWYRRYIVFQTSFFITGEFIYLNEMYNSLSFFDLGDKILTFTITSLVMYRVCLPLLKTYGIIIQKFIKKFHLIHFIHKGQYNKEINDKITRLSNYFTIVMSTSMLVAMTLFCLAPMYNNYQHGVSSKNLPENNTVQFALYYRFPFFNPENHYYVVAYSNFWLSYVATISICVNDMLLSLLVFQIICHIKTLKHNLHQLKKPKTQMAEIRCHKNQTVVNVYVEKFSPQENEQIHLMIVQCVEHHKFIVSFTDEFSNFFGPMLGSNYLFQLSSCCMLLLECSQGEPDALARYGPLSFIIFFQLVQISVIFEIVGTESETLKDSVYGVPWECMDLRNQRSVCILLQRAQTPIRITAMGMTVVGVQTMAAILKTTFSYFAFLLSISE